ncbi:MAG: SAM-dependent methyltransferase [Pseudomonadota bacterium]
MTSTPGAPPAQSAPGSGFAADWLALREEADRRARAAAPLDALRAVLDGRTVPLRVLDLGAGAGNNLRATAAELPCPQDWRLADHDPALLARATAALPQGVRAETATADLAAGIGLLLDTPGMLVTASAFFDLCGRAWLERLAGDLLARGAALYAVLSYDGREAWAPTHPDDTAVLAAFHADQRRDKGFGPSLGPEAHDTLAAALRTGGATVVEGTSDWILEPPADAALIAALAEGSASAVRPSLGSVADTWLAARRSASRVVIGHRDLLALPPGWPGA